MTVAPVQPVSISLAEAAQLVGCSTEHLRRLALDGEPIGAYRMDYRWLIVRDRLLAYIAEKVESTSAPSPGAPRSSVASQAAPESGESRGRLHGAGAPGSVSLKISKGRS